MHCAGGEESHEGVLVFQGSEKMGDLVFDAGDGGGEEFSCKRW